MGLLLAIISLGQADEVQSTDFDSATFMEHLGYEAMAVLIFLIPGPFVSFAKNALIYKKGKPEIFDLIVEALIWTLAIYGVVSAFGGSMPMEFSQRKVGEETLYGVSLKGRLVAVTIVVTLVVTGIYLYALNNDLLTRLLRTLRLTTQTSRYNIWLDTFAVQNNYVILHLSDGRRVFGWVKRYANEPKEGHIYLYNPSWIVANDDGTSAYQSTDADGFLFFQKDSISFIEFTKLTGDQAREANQPKD